MEANTGLSLQGLSKEVLAKAIEQVGQETPSKEWDLKLLTEDMHESAILFMRDYFVQHEPLVQVIGVQWDEDAGSYWRNVFKQGMTLVLTRREDEAIIAIRGLEVISTNDMISTENISDQRLRDLLEFINYCDGHAKFFEHYSCGEAIHFLGLAVHESYRRRGIATFMLTSAVDFVRHLGVGSVFIKGEASSNYSKRIYEKEDFDILFEQSYQDYRVHGRQVMHNIGEHKSYKIYGRHVHRLQS